MAPEVQQRRPARHRSVLWRVRREEVHGGLVEVSGRLREASDDAPHGGCKWRATVASAEPGLQLRHLLLHLSAQLPLPGRHLHDGLLGRQRAVLQRRLDVHVVRALLEDVEDPGIDCPWHRHRTELRCRCSAPAPKPLPYAPRARYVRSDVAWRGGR